MTSYELLFSYLSFGLEFVKLKDDNDWKLVTYDGYTSEDSSSLPPEFHLYVRSKFNTISNIEYDKYELNFRKENTSQWVFWITTVEMKEIMSMLTEIKEKDEEVFDAIYGRIVRKFKEVTKGINYGMGWHT